MRAAIFRWVMFIAALALLGVGIAYVALYLTASTALSNSGLELFYLQSMRALWLGFCLQAGLLALLFAVAAMRPTLLSRPMLVICGLLPISQGVLMLAFVHSLTGMAVLALGTVCLLIGAALWPPEVVAVVPSTADADGATAKVNAGAATTTSERPTSVRSSGLM